MIPDRAVMFFARAVKGYERGGPLDIEISGKRLAVKRDTQGNDIVGNEIPLLYYLDT